MRRATRKIGRGVLGVTSLAMLGGGLYAYNDQGARRAVVFWSMVLPAYAHYKYTEWKMVGKDEQEKKRAFGALHDHYAPICEKLILRLRGFFIKVAQLGSTRDDFIPEQYLVFFRSVQNAAPPAMNETEVAAEIEKSLDMKMSDVFLSFEPKSFASATIGQVHKAVLRSNAQEVAVKVQYPGCEQQFHSDIALVIAFCRLAFPQHVAPMQEFQKQFVSEFDYTKEAVLLGEVRANIMPEWGNRVQVPAPFPQLCRKNVLVMELLRGEKLTDAIIKQYTKLANKRGMTLEELKKEEIKKGSPSEQQMSRYIFYLKCTKWVKNVFARFWNNFGLGRVVGRVKLDGDWQFPLINIPQILHLLIDVHSYELFVNGEFNADPHPGNVMLLEDGRLGLVDYGQVGRISKEDTVKYARMIVALADDNREEVARLLVEEMGYVTRTTNSDHIWRWAAFYMDRDSDDVTGGEMPMTFMEHLDRIVPFSYVPPTWVMSVRLALILRSFGHAFGYPVSIAKAQKPFALKVLAEAQAVSPR